MVTPASAEELYEQVVKPLPPSERLKIATMILNDIPPQSVVNYSDEWSEEDTRDLTAHSLGYAAESFGEEDGAEGG
jgi:hypothetical protein